MLKYALICYAECKSLSYILCLEFFLYAFSGSLRVAVSQNTSHLLKINKQLLNCAFCLYLYLRLLQMLTICYKIFHTTFIRNSF